VENPESSDDEIPAKIAAVQAKENSLLEKLQDHPELPGLCEILEDLKTCRTERGEVTKIQENRVAAARQAVADQEAWIFTIDQAANSLK